MLVGSAIVDAVVAVVSVMGRDLESESTAGCKVEVLVGSPVPILASFAAGAHAEVEPVPALCPHLIVGEPQLRQGGNDVQKSIGTRPPGR